MTTKTKDSNLQMMEKRGKSPSSPHQRNLVVQHRRNPTPVALTEKQVPNYLKPTKSSRADPSSKPRLLKKQSSINDMPNKLTKRRSFDKPPSPSRGPKPYSTPATSLNSIRTASFSYKTILLSEEKSRSLTKSSTMDVRKKSYVHHAIPSDVRKSSLATTTTNEKQYKGLSSMTLTKKSSVVTTTATPKKVISYAKSEPGEKYQESVPSETEIDSEMDEDIYLVEIREPEEDIEHTKGTISEKDLDIFEDSLYLCDPSIVIEDRNAMLSIELEEANQSNVDQTRVKENNHREIKEIDIEECFEDNTDYTQNESDGLKTEIEIEEEVVSMSPKEEVRDEAKDATKCEEIPQVEEVDNILKVEHAQPSVVKKSTQGGHQGKKDTTTYNDVIEEMVSKLREQRRNKVKALVGAFETVISLESETTPN